MMVRKFAIFIVVALIAAASASAQNLLDNDAYKKATQLRDQAQQAYDNGDYAQAKQLSEQSQQYAQQAVQVAQQLALGYKATNWIDIARKYVDFAQQAKAQERYPDAWKKAEPEWTTAQSAYSAKDFQKSIDASQAVVVALQDVRLPAVATAPPTPAQAPLPAFYVVRLIPNNRDCFWNIAAYPFVYGDPLKWQLLYQANKQMLQDPNNPNLIQPGMKFSIPSINGEKREGTYKP